METLVFSSARRVSRAPAKASIVSPWLSFLRNQASKADRTPARQAVASATTGAVRQAYAQLPLSFVPNAGQADARVRYAAQREWELRLLKLTR